MKTIQNCNAHENFCWIDWGSSHCFEIWTRLPVYQLLSILLSPTLLPPSPSPPPKKKEKKNKQTTGRRLKQKENFQLLHHTTIVVRGDNKGLNFSTKLVAYEQIQQANKATSSSPGLKDFATEEVDGILHLPDGQVKLFWVNIFEKLWITQELKGIKLLLSFIFNHFYF